jgi:hypothetical protein
MKLVKWTILFFTLLPALCAFGQDTVSVYFDFGSSKIQEKQSELLGSIPTNYDLSSLDSVHFIGMADSVGGIKANIKLSEKRAKGISKRCKKLFPKDFPYRISALGEKNNKRKPERNRRVDVVLYFKVSVPEPEPTKPTITIAKDRCYYIDYRLLHTSHFRTITKGKRELVIVESENPKVLKKKEHYYASQKKGGKVITKRLKWKGKRTGNLWWAKTRYVATLPKKSFDQFKIFKVGDLPCDTCSEAFLKKPEITKEDTCKQVDYFLMENLQIKTRFLKKKVVKVRAPREYVNLDFDYAVDWPNPAPITWDTKKGRKRKRYYYTVLPLRESSTGNYTANITRAMNCCKYKPKCIQCQEDILHCRHYGGPDNLTLIGEIGSHYQQSTITPYAGLGLNLEGRSSRLMLVSGLDSDLSFYGSLRYNYNVATFPFSMLNPASIWQKPSGKGLVNRFAQLYIGTEFKTRMNKTIPNYVEQNVHIGLAAVNRKREAIFSRFFVQYGGGYDYLRNNSSDLYSIVQLGINIRIARLNGN